MVATPEVNSALLADITDKIVREFHPYKIILFGSYADGSPNSDSDLDLFVVMGPDKQAHYRAMDIRAVAKIPYLAMDVIVRTPKEVEERISINDFFIMELLEKGRVLYERITV